MLFLLSPAAWLLVYGTQYSIQLGFLVDVVLGHMMDHLRGETERNWPTVGSSAIQQQREYFETSASGFLASM